MAHNPLTEAQKKLLHFYPPVSREEYPMPDDAQEDILEMSKLNNVKRITLVRAGERKRTVVFLFPPYPEIGETVTDKETKRDYLVVASKDEKGFIIPMGRRPLHA